MDDVCTTLCIDLKRKEKVRKGGKEEENWGRGENRGGKEGDDIVKNQ